ncbi:MULTISPECIES: hypothetical protein [Burkholderiaceae]|uniref:hypothetical protein n=1 Tax=Burkholderiaceae TaxID=119060 RepID=UPI00117E3F6B|nr:MULTISPECIES: hypothetical protein [Burkholderiaceae]
MEERFIGDNPSSRLGGNVKATAARLTCNGLRHSRLWIESLIADHGRRRFFFSSLIAHPFKRAIALHAATVHSPRFFWMYASALCILEAEYRVQTSNCASACANFEGGFLNTHPVTLRANVDSASKLALAVPETWMRLLGESSAPLHLAWFERGDTLIAVQGLSHKDAIKRISLQHPTGQNGWRTPRNARKTFSRFFILLSEVFFESSYL